MISKNTGLLIKIFVYFFKEYSQIYFFFLLFKVNLC